MLGIRLKYWDGKYQSVEGWYATRKYNGMSAIWIPKTRGLPVYECVQKWSGLFDTDPQHPDRISTGLWTLGRFAGTRTILAPDEWLDQLPGHTSLHGEIWHPSDDLSMVTSANKKREDVAEANAHLWDELKFVALNANILGENDASMYDNLIAARRLYHGCGDVIVNPEITKLNSQVVLNTMLASYERNKWEGLCFMHPTECYSHGVSDYLRKFKPDFEDEAEIIGYKEGNKANEGMLGSLQVKMVVREKHDEVTGYRDEFCGTTAIFNVSGMQRFQRKWDYVYENFPIGGKVNFTYKMFTSKGCPASANFTKVVRDE